MMFENRGAFAFLSELFVLTAAFNPVIQSDEHIAAPQPELWVGRGCHAFSTENQVSHTLTKSD